MNFKFAQMPPPFPPPQAMPPTMNMSAPVMEDTEQKKSTEPLDSLGKILKDAGLEEMFNNTSKSPKEIAMEIWTEYGGDIKGKSFKKGNRIKNSNVDDIEETLNKRWLRLPKGMGIDQITNLDEISDVVNGALVGYTKKLSKPAGPTPPPGLASSRHKIIKLAKILDDAGMYNIVDNLSY